ncbi:MAG: CRISPR-associated protein Cas4 [Candidatus Aminicenantes bacterium]|nr:CRISPR-associated protein Cas4 [Candidatus Aminicenantes bacterium]
MHITGNLVNAYFICRRKFWLFARQLTPDPKNDLLLLGRLISDSAYNRQRKELIFDSFRIDFIRKQKENIIVCEIKKSSKGLKAAEMQLGYYLLKFKEMGINARGEILIPREKKKIVFELHQNIEETLKEAIKNMQELATKANPPAVNKTSFCRKCAFYEFCFS